jgi:hypothetical protein
MFPTLATLIFLFSVVFKIVQDNFVSENHLRLFLGLFPFIDPSLNAISLKLVLPSKVLLSRKGWFLTENPHLNPVAL